MHLPSRENLRLACKKHSVTGRSPLHLLQYHLKAVESMRRTDFSLLSAADGVTRTNNFKNILNAFILIVFRKPVNKEALYYS